MNVHIHLSAGHRNHNLSPLCSSPAPDPNLSTLIRQHATIRVQTSTRNAITLNIINKYSINVPSYNKIQNPKPNE